MKAPGPSVSLRPIATAPGADASLALAITGLPVGKPITVEIYEVDPPSGSRAQQRQQSSGDILLGSISGTVAQSDLATKLSGVPTIVLTPDAPPPKPPDKGPTTEIFVPGVGTRYAFAIPPEVLDIDEGDYWEVQAHQRSGGVVAHRHRCAHPALSRAGAGQLCVARGKPEVNRTTPEGFQFLPDGDPSDSLWTWTCRGSLLPLGKAAE